jgi:hypothetical protein
MRKMDIPKSPDYKVGLLGSDFNIGGVGLKENPTNPKAPKTTGITSFIQGALDQGEDKWGPLIPLAINFALLNEYRPDGLIPRNPNSQEFKEEYSATIKGERPYLLITSKQIQDALIELRDMRTEEEESGKIHPLYKKVLLDWTVNRDALKKMVKKNYLPSVTPKAPGFSKFLAGPREGR